MLIEAVLEPIFFNSQEPLLNLKNFEAISGPAESSNLIFIDPKIISNVWRDFTFKIVYLSGMNTFKLKPIDGYHFQTLNWWHCPFGQKVDGFMK